MRPYAGPGPWSEPLTVPAGGSRVLEALNRAAETCSNAMRY